MSNYYKNEIRSPRKLDIFATGLYDKHVIYDIIKYKSQIGYNLNNNSIILKKNSGIIIKSICIEPREMSLI